MDEFEGEDNAREVEEVADTDSSAVSETSANVADTNLGGSAEPVLGEGGATSMAVDIEPMPDAWEHGASSLSTDSDADDAGDEASDNDIVTRGPSHVAGPSPIDELDAVSKPREMPSPAA